MIKVEEGLYLYKGVYVKKLDNGMFIAHFYINSITGMCTVSAATEQVFKKVFDKFVKANKGLNIERYQKSMLMRG